MVSETSGIAVVVKLSTSKNIFNITTDGLRHLAAVIWSGEYTYPEFLNYAKIGVTHFCGKKKHQIQTR